MAQVQSGTVYKLTNDKAPTSCLDLSGGDNKSIIGYEYHNGDNQKWRFQQEGNNWVIQNAGTGKYLGFEGEPKDGTSVVVVDNAVKWDVRNDEENQNVMRIFVPNTNLNVDLSDHGNAAPGTPITLWGKWKGRNQCWKFEQV